MYSWRRHLTAAFQRLQIDVGMTQQRSATVGFADLVDFTGLSRRLSDDDLVGLVNRFEGRIGDLVTGFGGRVVKSMGDEVLFVTDKPDVRPISPSRSPNWSAGARSQEFESASRWETSSCMPETYSATPLTWRAGSPR